MLGIHVLFGFTREPIHAGPSPKKNQSSASRYEIPKTDPNFFAQTRFTSSKFTSGFRFFHFLRRESGGRESRAQTLYSKFLGHQNLSFITNKTGSITVRTDPIRSADRGTPDLSGEA